MQCSQLINRADRKTRIFKFENTTARKSCFLASIWTLIFFTFFGGRFLLPPRGLKFFKSLMRAEKFRAVFWCERVHFHVFLELFVLSWAEMFVFRLHVTSFLRSSLFTFVILILLPGDAHCSLLNYHVHLLLNYFEFLKNYLQLLWIIQEFFLNFF